mmetsp:Transcript_16270/g.35609  ORF Transcript_16270/g.35609 Transcript_16270/m.35609 type:complete len:275 (-) Transcript_16270:69-893(-)
MESGAPSNVRSPAASPALRLHKEKRAAGRVLPGACLDRRRGPRGLLFAALVHPIGAMEVCLKGEAVRAFFAGQVDMGSGAQACTPDLDPCFFNGKVAGGPTPQGMYRIDWDDGDQSHKEVSHLQVLRVSNGKPCGAAAAVVKASPRKAGPAFDEEDENWVPPEIPCTILPRLHWEGSDPEWNKEAIQSLREQFSPDEIIDGFDWHVILRFNDADRCEQVYVSLDETLRRCQEEDIEKCRTHQYVKAIEYVGDDPETRRKTGRRIHKPEATGEEL